jgi:hypothetical protein
MKALKILPIISKIKKNFMPKKKKAIKNKEKTIPSTPKIFPKKLSSIKKISSP